MAHQRRAEVIYDAAAGMLQSFEELRLFRSVGALWTGASNVRRASVLCFVRHRRWRAELLDRAAFGSIVPHQLPDLSSPAPPPICRPIVHISLPDGSGCVTLLTVFGSYAVAVWAYERWGPGILSYAKDWAGRVRFDWEPGCRDQRGFDFCPLRGISSAIPLTARRACSAAAAGAAWLPHTSGSFYGVIGAAGKRSDLERAAALAGAIVKICFYGYNEELLAFPLPGAADVAALTREAYLQDRALQTASRVWWI